MFTGLIEEIGKIKATTKTEKSAKLTISAKKVLEDLKIGDSISTNGVCLTVTSFSANSFQVDVMAETVRRSNLHMLVAGDSVNLERAMQLGERLGGHMVSGHIDGIGEIIGYEEEENAVWVTILPKQELLRYIIEKGSIAIDGISLTVAHVDERDFKVSIIPHTKDSTTLLKKKLGAIVNLECDMVGKYIEKLMRAERQTTYYGAEDGRIDMKMLKENGFC